MRNVPTVGIAESISQAMKAIIQEKYGSPDDLKLREVDLPAVDDNEVLVRVRAASLHPDVWHVVWGRPYFLRLMGGGLVQPRNPIPGTDMAGVVESVGKSVTQFQPGDEVFGETAGTHQWTNGGAFAEYVSVPQDNLALKPGNITFQQAAAVPTSGFIALFNLPALSEFCPGQEVLINGAGGGVGLLALQLARAHGARITAVDSTGKLDMLRALGADRVIDYTREDFTRSGLRYDLIVDIPGNHPFSACRRVLAADGKYVIVGHQNYDLSSKRFFGLIPYFFKLMFLARFFNQLGRGHSPRPDKKEAMAIYRKLIEARTITPIVDSTYPMSEVREAFRHMVEDETLGKVIINP